MYSSNPAWSDVTGIVQDDGSSSPPVVIAYSERYTDAMNYFRAVWASGELSARVLSLTSDIISMNPSHYTIWHLRRECLLSTRDADCRVPGLAAEMELTERVLGNTSKNYQVWHHRRWVASLLGGGLDTLRGELELTQGVISLETKHYHAWSHRAWALQHWDSVKGWLSEDAFTLSCLLMAHEEEDAHHSKSSGPALVRSCSSEFEDGGVESGSSNSSSSSSSSSRGASSSSISPESVDVRNNSAWSHRWMILTWGRPATRTQFLNSVDAGHEGGESLMTATEAVEKSSARKGGVGGEGDARGVSEGEEGGVVRASSTSSSASSSSPPPAATATAAVALSAASRSGLLAAYPMSQEAIKIREIGYVKRALRLASRNESAWSYLRSILNLAALELEVEAAIALAIGKRLHTEDTTPSLSMIIDSIKSSTSARSQAHRQPSAIELPPSCNLLVSHVNPLLAPFFQRPSASTEIASTALPTTANATSSLSSLVTSLSGSFNSSPVKGPIATAGGGEEESEYDESEINAFAFELQADLLVGQALVLCSGMADGAVTPGAHAEAVSAIGKEVRKLFRVCESAQPMRAGYWQYRLRQLNLLFL